MSLVPRLSNPTVEPGLLIWGGSYSIALESVDGVQGIYEPSKNVVQNFVCILSKEGL